MAVVVVIAVVAVAVVAAVLAVVAFTRWGRLLDIHVERGVYPHMPNQGGVYWIRLAFIREYKWAFIIYSKHC